MASINVKHASQDVFNITPSDSLDIKSDAANTKLHDACFVMCKTTGNISVITVSGKTIDFASVPVFTVLGDPFPILVRRVRSTGTTGTWCGLVPENNG